MLRMGQGARGQVGMGRVCTSAVASGLPCMSDRKLLLARQLMGSRRREIECQDATVGGQAQRFLKNRNVGTSHDAAQLAADRGTLREVSVALARQHTDSTMDER